MRTVGQLIRMLMARKRLFLGQNVLLNLKYLTFHGVAWLDSVLNVLSPGIGVY